MAKGENAKRINGKEWWGKRPLSGTSVSKKGKGNTDAHFVKKQFCV